MGALCRKVQKQLSETECLNQTLGDLPKMNEIDLPYKYFEVV